MAIAGDIIIVVILFAYLQCFRLTVMDATNIYNPAYQNICGLNVKPGMRQISDTRMRRGVSRWSG